MTPVAHHNLHTRVATRRNYKLQCTQASRKVRGPGPGRVGARGKESAQGRWKRRLGAGQAPWWVCQKTEVGQTLVAVELERHGNRCLWLCGSRLVAHGRMGRSEEAKASRKSRMMEVFRKY
jgi:hypothetical protein